MKMHWKSMQRLFGAVLFPLFALLFSKSTPSFIVFSTTRRERPDVGILGSEDSPKQVVVRESHTPDQPPLSSHDWTQKSYSVRTTTLSSDNNNNKISPKNFNFSGVMARSFVTEDTIIRLAYSKEEEQQQTHQQTHQQTQRRDPFPCFEADERVLDISGYQDITNATRGFLYMKPLKCASTTAASVSLRIARNVARRRRRRKRTQSASSSSSSSSSTTTINSELCKVHFSHGNTNENPLHAKRYHNRDRWESFLWTIIREPTNRLASLFTFRYARNGRNVNNRIFQKFLLKQNPAHYYLCTLRTANADDEAQEEYFCNSTWNMMGVNPRIEAARKGLLSKYNSSKDTSSSLNTLSAVHLSLRPIILNAANELIQEYDFIGITERFDESLVVLMMLLDLSLADIMFLSGKSNNGGFGAAVKEGDRCSPIPPTTLSPAMQRFLETPFWKQHILSDVLIYQAANRSLDMTIDQLGRETVEANVALLGKLNQAAEERCQPRVIMPCDTAGALPRPANETDCYARDMGCGMECLDEVAIENNLLF